jgi:hypothetical protein
MLTFVIAGQIMSDSLSCYRCGASLSALSLPIVRKDLCPDCGVELHVCRMCIHFDPAAPAQCREDDAEDVKEKELANFCEWFEPSGTAFESRHQSEADQALEELEAMFSALADRDP